MGSLKPTRHSSSHGSTRIGITYRRIAELRLDPKNPRFHSPRQIRQIARSIEAFDFNVPVLVDSNLKIIAGHGRVLACQELGWTEVPTICLEHLSAAQARAFMIADNRLSETSQWSDRLLAEQLKELSLVDLDFDLEVTGFDMGEIDLRIEGLDAQPDRDNDPADILPAAPAGPPVNQIGDLWQLAGHRLLCGSALDPRTYVAVMQGERAAMVFTDPPYNLKIAGHVSGLGAVRHQDFEMASGEMDEAEFTDFLTRSCLLMGRHSEDGSIHFIFMDWRHIGELLAA